MRDFKDCVPADAHDHYNDLFKQTTTAERDKYNAKILAICNATAVQVGRSSGHADKASWVAKTEQLDGLAIGCVEDVLTVYEERELLVTPAVCTCLKDTAREYLDVVYKQQLQLSADGMLGFRLLNSCVQEMSTRKFVAMPTIDTLIERAKLASEKKQREHVSQETPSSVTIHTINNITQNISGSNNATAIMGDVTQQQQYNFNQIEVVLESLLNALKSSPLPIDEEDLKLLEDAENAAKEHNPTKLQRCLVMVSEGAWKVAKSLAVEGIVGLIKLGAPHLLR